MKMNWTKLMQWIKTWIFKLLCLMSQIINALILNGEPDQTISSRAYALSNVKKWAWVEGFINFIFFWEENHCYKSWRLDVEFSKRVIERSTSTR